MKQERFMRFISLIDGIHKGVQRIRVDNAAAFGIKSVHILWIYELLLHPEGLSATELAEASHIDRSLISREISVLEANGFIEIKKQNGKRNYNSKLTLTESGIEAAAKIKQLAMNFQTIIGKDIPENDLATFYNVLAKLYENLESLNEEKA
ncbi:MAG: MarR family transcriptional regulator [Ruminococcaceae bacterium]|nr:MarR family transcriptional regulator [Oscillospiraceae bacterium]